MAQTERNVWHNSTETGGTVYSETVALLMRRMQYNKDNPQELFTKLRGILNQLLINEELKPEDITILTFKAKNKSFLNDFNYDHCAISLFEDTTKNTIRVDTVRRFKGMESNVVIVCEMDDQNCMNDPELYEEMRYVAYSRAKHHLVIVPYELSRS